MQRVIEIIINCPTRAVAEDIASRVVATRLAACANIHAAIDSRYHWQGRIERQRETPLVIKTRVGLYQQIVALVERLHPYETPGILGREVGHVNRAYTEWVNRETTSPGEA